MSFQLLASSKGKGKGNGNGKGNGEGTSENDGKGDGRLRMMGRVCEAKDAGAGGKFQRKNVEEGAEHFARNRVCTGDSSAGRSKRDASRESRDW